MCLICQLVEQSPINFTPSQWDVINHLGDRWAAGIEIGVMWAFQTRFPDVKINTGGDLLPGCHDLEITDVKLSPAGVFTVEGKVKPK